MCFWDSVWVPPQGDLLPVIDVHGDQRAPFLHFLLFFLRQNWGEITLALEEVWEEKMNQDRVPNTVLNLN